MIDLLKWVKSCNWNNCVMGSLQFLYTKQKMKSTRVFVYQDMFTIFIFYQNIYQKIHFWTFQVNVGLLLYFRKRKYQAFFFFFFFFFETDHAVHGLPQIALCVYSRGRVGFVWGGVGFLLLWKKIWVCCHIQVYVQLYDALIFISMPAWPYFHFWFILGLTTFGYSVMAVFIFWLFLLDLVHSLPPFLHTFAWSWLLLPLSQW